MIIGSSVKAGIGCQQGVRTGSHGAKGTMMF